MNGDTATVTAPPNQDDEVMDSFLGHTAQAKDDDQLDGFLHNTAPTIARQKLDEYKEGKLSLDDDQVQHLSKVAQDGVGAWESLDRSSKYIFGHRDETLRGIGGMIVGGAKGIAAANQQLTQPEDQLVQDLSAGHPIDALWNYGLNKYKTYSNISQGTVRGVTGLVPALGGATSEVAELAAEPFLSKEQAQDFNAKLNFGAYQAENLKNRAFNRIAELSKVDPNNPLYQAAEQIAPMAVPVGGEESVAGKIGSAVGKAVDVGTRAAGKVVTAGAKTAKATAPIAGAAALYEAGHPVGALFELGAGYGGFGLAALRRKIIDAPMNAVENFGKTMSKVPDGETILGTARASVDDEVSRLTEQLSDLKSKHGDKVADAFKTTPDGKPLYTSAELTGDSAKARAVQDNLVIQTAKRDKLQSYEAVNKALSAAARTGIKVGMDAAVAGGIGAGFAGSTESPGEYEQAKKGFEAGAALGLAARAPRIPLDIRGEIRQFNRTALVRSGESALPKDHPNFEAHKQAMGSITQDARDYVNTYSGLARANGGNVVVLRPEDFAQSLGGKAEDAPNAPNGYYDSQNKTAYINSEALVRGPVPHEVSHALEEAGGLLQENHPVNKALDEMILNPKYHKAIQDAAARYKSEIHKSDPSFELTPQYVKSEIVADLASDIMQRETPQGLYGGRSLAQKAGDLFKRFLGTQPISTSAFGWPVTPELRNAVADSLFQAGEKAAQRSPAVSALKMTTPETQARQDAIDAINSLNKNTSKKMRSVVTAQVDDAIQKMKAQGEPIEVQKIIAATQQRPVPKIVGPALKTPQGIEKGVIGQTHADLMKGAVNSGNESAIDALSDEANHLFHDDQGQLHDRESAAQIAGRAGQVPPDTTKLQSENLADKSGVKTAGATEPASSSPAVKPIADFLASRHPTMTKEETLELHRAMDRGDIKNADDLERWIEERHSGPRGEALKAIKVLQDSGEPFTGAYVKTNGSLRTMNGQFGVQKGLKGGTKSTASNPDLVTYYDHDAKGYRTFDINRLNSLQGEGVNFRASKKYMPSDKDKPSERIVSPAIRVNDLQFTGSTIEEAKAKARAFGLSPDEIKKGEQGFVTRKGVWKTPDEASTLTGETGQMGPQQTETPLRVQAFNRWRKFQPKDNNPELVNLGNGLTPEENKRYLAIKANPEPTTQEADEFSALVDKMNAHTENEGEVRRGEGEMKQVKGKQFMPGQPFYSQLERTISEQPGKASPEQLRAAILKGPGIKQAELKETKDQLGTSFDQWLKDNPKATKSQMLDFVRENQVLVKEVEKGQVPDLPRELKAAGFRMTHGPQGDERLWHGRKLIESSSDAPRQHQDLIQDFFDSHDQASEVKFGPDTHPTMSLPGGTNYGETLATLPPPSWYYKGRRDAPSQTAESKVFRSGHWDEPNVILHLRHNERETPNGKMFLIEELQSDAHQQGRQKGYKDDAKWNFLEKEYSKLADQFPPEGNRDPEAAKRLAEISDEMNRLGEGIPDLPFKGQGWKTLGLKIALRKAVESGAKELGWTTGAQQAERYDLSKHLDTVVYSPDSQRLEGYAKDSSDSADPIIDINVPPEKLADHIGKEAAEKIMNGKPDKMGQIYLSNQDLKVGGQGMVGFYDKELVNLANDLVKKWGVKVGKTRIESDINVTDGGYRLQGREGESPSDAMERQRREARQGVEVHSVPITESMRRDILEKGQPLFQPKGDVQPSTPTKGAKTSLKPVAQSEKKKRKKKSRYTIREKAEAE